jgi:hypothetical protein
MIEIKVIIIIIISPLYLGRDSQNLLGQIYKIFITLSFKIL